MHFSRNGIRTRSKLPSGQGANNYAVTASPGGVISQWRKLILAADQAILTVYFWVVSYQERLVVIVEKHRGHAAAFSYLRRVTENFSPHLLQHSSAEATVRNLFFSRNSSSLD